MVNEIDGYKGGSPLTCKDPIQLAWMVNEIDRGRRLAAGNLLHHPDEPGGVGRDYRGWSGVAVNLVRRPASWMGSARRSPSSNTKPG